LAAFEVITEAKEDSAIHTALTLLDERAQGVAEWGWRAIWRCPNSWQRARYHRR
jgi:hypothetical protein